RYVVAKRRFLRRVPLGPCAEEVQAGLAHDPNAVRARQLRNLRERIVVLTRGREASCLVWVQGDPSDNGRVLRDRGGGPLSRLDVAANLHHAVYASRASVLEALFN